MLTDAQALLALPILRTMAARSHCAREDREDVVQSALLRLCEYGPVLDTGLEFMCSWAINAPAQRSYRRMKKLSLNARLEEQRLRELCRIFATDTQARGRADASECVRAALRLTCLSSEEKYVVDAVLSGRSQSSIAEEMGVSLTTVSKRLHRAYDMISESVDLGVLY